MYWTHAGGKIRNPIKSYENSPISMEDWRHFFRVPSLTANQSGPPPRLLNWAVGKLLLGIISREPRIVHPSPNMRKLFFCHTFFLTRSWDRLCWICLWNNLRCISVIRKDQISSRVGTFLRFTEENQGEARKNQGVQGLSFLHTIFHMCSCYNHPP